MAIDLSKANVLTYPWDNKRTRDNLLHIKSKNFEYCENEHICYYYKELNLCYIGNGNHSINAGRYYKKGIINAIECDITKIIPYIKTDGIYWYSIDDGKTIDDNMIEDFRLAAVYALAQKRYELTSDLNH